jgi:hypothetical protein
MRIPTQKISEHFKRTYLKKCPCTNSTPAVPKISFNTHILKLGKELLLPT